MSSLTGKYGLQLNTALLQLQRSEYSTAIETLKRMAVSFPATPEIQQLLGICLAKTRNDTEAEHAFRSALELMPDHPETLANLATLLKRMKRHDEAIVCWQSAVTIAPNFTQAWQDLGLTELSLGKPISAISSLQKAVELNPMSELAWHGLGNALRQTGRLEAAESAFLKVRSINPKSASALINLGAVQRLSGRPEDALKSYQSARDAGHQSAMLEDASLGVLLDIGQVAGALQQARNLVIKYPEYTPGYTTLATVLWEHGSVLAPDEDPLAEFRSAAWSQPDNLELRLAFAKILLATNGADEAFELLEAESLDADHAESIQLRAEALQQLGRRDESSHLFERLYLGVGANNPIFLNTYTRHLLKIGDWDKAAECAIHTTGLSPDDQEAWAYLGTAWRLLDDPREFWLCDYQRHIAFLDVEVPAGYRDMADFLAALQEVLEPLHKAKREPFNQSLRGGSQTTGRLFGRPQPELQKLRSILQATVQNWLSELPIDPAHPFLRHHPQSTRFTGSWSVKLWSSGNHANHFHPDGWLSSAFYVALPESVEKAADSNLAGHIQFGQPLESLGLNLIPCRTIKPEVGKLALFPSYMWHGTVPFIDSQPRISIAFDMQPST